MIEPISTFGGVALAWAWEQWGKDWAEDAVGKVKEKWQQFNWQNAAEQYRQRLLKDYGEMRIFGMTEPVPLENIFSEAYLLDEVQAHRHHSYEKLAAEFSQRQRRDESTRRHALQLVQQKPRLYILGKPGAGKTTFLKYVTVQACHGKLDKIPMMVVLRDWAAKSAPDLLSYLVQEFALCGLPEARSFVEHLLESGRALVLLDGLDEVSKENKLRLSLIKQMEALMRQYGACHYVLTCRVAANEYFFEKLTYVEMADFNETQIKTFIKKWFQPHPRKLAAFEPQFWAQENWGLQDLAKNPLMLTLLCIAFEETMTLFKRRVAIYDKAIDAILDKWDSSRAITRGGLYKNLDTLRKKQLFAKLAAEYFAKNKLVMPQQDVVTWLEKALQSPGEQPNGAAILREIEHQHGLLVERAEKLYTFAHLTFQEYFTALYLAQRESRWQNWLTSDIITIDRWREVILFVAALLDEADDFVLQFQTQANQLISTDSALLTLFRWADQRAQAATGTLSMGDKRLAYIDMGLIALAPPWTPFDSSLPRAHTLTTAFSRAHTLATVANQLDRNHNHNLDYKLDLDRNLDRNLNHESRELGLEYQILFLGQHANLFTLVPPEFFTSRFVPQLLEYLAWWQEVQSFSEITAWETTLKAIQFPTLDVPQAAWQPVAQSLHAALIHQLAIPDIQLGETQVHQLSKYYFTTQLLDECLKVASVSVAVRQQLEDGRFKVA